jgi:hypothetical protein
MAQAAVLDFATIKAERAAAAAAQERSKMRSANEYVGLMCSISNRSNP